LKKKAIFLPPPTNQILSEKSKELYLIDITEIPIKIKKIILLRIKIKK